MRMRPGRNTRNLRPNRNPQYSVLGDPPLLTQNDSGLGSLDAVSDARRFLHNKISARSRNYSLGNVRGRNRQEYCSTCSSYLINDTFENHCLTALHLQNEEILLSNKKQLNENTASPNSSPGKSYGDTRFVSVAPSLKAPIDASSSSANNCKLEFSPASSGHSQPVSTKTPQINNSSLNPEDIVPRDYDPKTNFGTHFVIPIQGYFCRVCNKFFNKDQRLYNEHCRTKAHYDNVVRILMARKRELHEANSLD